MIEEMPACHYAAANNMSPRVMNSPNFALAA